MTINQTTLLLIPRDWWPALQDTLGPEEPGWWYKRKYTGSKKAPGKSQKKHPEPTNDRPSRSGPTHNYTELPDDSKMEEDSEED